MTVNVSFTFNDAKEPVPVILADEPDILPNTSKSELPTISPMKYPLPVTLISVVTNISPNEPVPVSVIEPVVVEFVVI